MHKRSTDERKKTSTSYSYKHATIANKKSFEPEKEKEKRNKRQKIGPQAAYVIHVIYCFIGAFVVLFYVDGTHMWTMFFSNWCSF